MNEPFIDSYVARHVLKTNPERCFKSKILSDFETTQVKVAQKVFAFQLFIKPTFEICLVFYFFAIIPSNEITSIEKFQRFHFYRSIYDRDCTRQKAAQSHFNVKTQRKFSNLLKK